ncbi:unnamed protein product [Calypogeia fissa]
MPAPPGSLLENEIGAPPPVKSNPPVSAGAPTPTFPPHPFFPLCFQSTTTSTKPEKELFRPYTHPPFNALRKKTGLAQSVDERASLLRHKKEDDYVDNRCHWMNIRTSEQTEEKKRTRGALDEEAEERQSSSRRRRRRGRGNGPRARDTERGVGDLGTVARRAAGRGGSRAGLWFRTDSDSRQRTRQMDDYSTLRYSTVLGYYYWATGPEPVGAEPQAAGPGS